MTNENFSKLFGFQRREPSDIREVDMDLAASIQKVTGNRSEGGPICKRDNRKRFFVYGWGVALNALQMDICFVPEFLTIFGCSLLVEMWKLSWSRFSVLVSRR